jgi:predicted DCC family thiol-disulfide oxidoreductase YuxK
MDDASPTDLVLVYDGDCSMCRGVVRALASANLVPPERTRAFQDQTGELAERLERAGIRNEMAVLDLARGEIRSGVDGFVWILRATWARPLVAVAAWPPLAPILRVAYRTIAYNRSILAPKDPGRIRCACDADFRLGYRLVLLVALVALALALAAAFGATLARSGAQASERALALRFAAALAAAWLVPAARAATLPRERAFEWLGHLAVAAALGALLLAPAALLGRWIEGRPLLAAQIAALAVAAAATARSLARRARAAGVALAWVAAWGTALAAALAVALLPLTV